MNEWESVDNDVEKFEIILEIAAEVELVFQHLERPEMMLHWMPALKMVVPLCAVLEPGSLIRASFYPPRLGDEQVLIRTDRKSAPDCLDLNYQGSKCAMTIKYCLSASVKGTKVRESVQLHLNPIQPHAVREAHLKKARDLELFALESLKYHLEFEHGYSSGSET